MTPQLQHDLLVTNIGQLATPLGAAPRAGDDMEALLCERDYAVATSGSKISWVGPARDAPKAQRVVDAGGALVTPGLVDCDTHLVFSGYRRQELPQKLAGVPYIDILMEGGGILATTTATRATPFDDLYTDARHTAQVMLAHGVTMCESKSGYGLEQETELKQLRVLRQVNVNAPMGIVPTFMGAHAVPQEFLDDRQAYVELLCNEMIPAVAEQKLARYCDVFCEVAAFTAAEAEQVLCAAAAHGMKLKLHADLLEPIGGSMLAAELGAASCAHLVATPIHAMTAMAEAGVVGVLTPAVSYFMEKPYARAYEMLKAGMALALATGFNPGTAPSCNLQLVMSLGSVKFHLTPAQVLCAVTLNAAAAIGLASYCGTLEVGKAADLVIWDVPDLDTLMYRFGTNLVKKVIVDGKEAAPSPR